jgi:choline dehydrogenase-like flavoprotein
MPKPNNLEFFMDSVAEFIKKPAGIFSFALAKDPLDIFTMEFFWDSWVRRFVDDKDDVATVLKMLKTNELLQKSIMEQGKGLLEIVKVPSNPRKVPGFLKNLMAGLTNDALRASKNFDTVSRFAIKYILSWSRYALEPAEWKNIGYLGPRTKPFWPPDVIVKNNIVMTKGRCTQAKFSEEHNPLGFNDFEDDVYTKEMREKNLLLKKKVRDISECPDDYAPDVIIIGTGPGGATVAYTLSQKLKGKKIAVLERGDLYTSDEFDQTERNMLPKLYQKPGARFTDDFGIAIIQGSLVGGSATLNHGVCYEAPHQVTKHWDRDISKDLKDGGYYKRVEEMINYKKISENALNKNGQMLLEGLKRPGSTERDIGHFEYNERNTNARGNMAGRYHQLSCTGCGCCVLGCRYNRKQTPLITFIPEAIKNGSSGANGNEVRVFKKATVTEVLYKDGKVTGVQLKDRAKPIHAKTVVVSCGAINTAQLLIDSGLDEIDPDIGKNISLHPSPLIYGLFDSGTDDDKIYADWGIPMSASYAKYQFKTDENNFPYDYGYILETIYNHPAATAITFPLSGMKERMKNYEKIACISVILHDQAVGKVGKNAGLLTCLSYTLAEEDKDKLRHAIRTAAAILLDAGAKEVFTNHEEELVFRSKADLDKADTCSLEPGDILLATAHPQGGVGMGKPENGVVDFNGHLHDIENLYVSDASLFPTSLGVNPQLTVMAMGLKIGDHIAEKLNA